MKKQEIETPEVEATPRDVSGKLGAAPKTDIVNCTTLRNDLMDVYNQLRLGDIGMRQAKEIANMSGKIVSSAKAQLDYNVTIGKADTRIDFFED